MMKLSAPELSIRLLAIGMMVAREVYWRITEHRANQAKPKRHKITRAGHAKRFISLAVALLILAQLLGLSVLPYGHFPALELLGLVLAVFGFVMAMSARYTLGINWAHAAEYQIKERHELITNGIYRYVRHPIYAGLFISFLGAELIVGSRLSVVFGIVLPLVALSQAKKEETILVREFGDRYRRYMVRSKRFLPYLW